MEKILLCLVLLRLVNVYANIVANNDNASFFLVPNAALEANKTEKLSLRYGLQQTQECPDFQKAYLCIKYCLEHGYHVAKSDKRCKCMCYKRRDHDAFFGTRKTTRYYPVPTTSKPAWAGGNLNHKLSAMEKNHASFESNETHSDYSYSSQEKDSNKDNKGKDPEDDDGVTATDSTDGTGAPGGTGDAGDATGATNAVSPSGAATDP